MATIDDLDREVRRLRKRINELENAPAAREQREVNQLLGEDASDRPNAGGFARAAADSRAAARARLGVGDGRRS